MCSFQILKPTEKRQRFANQGSTNRSITPNNKQQGSAGAGRQNFVGHSCVLALFVNFCATIVMQDNLR